MTGPSERVVEPIWITQTSVSLSVFQHGGSFRWVVHDTTDSGDDRWNYDRRRLGEGLASSAEEAWIDAVLCLPNTPPMHTWDAMRSLR